MKIDADFAGGNVKIVKVTDNEAWLEPDLSDTSDEWFYFNFRVRGAAGKTVVFRMGGVPYGYVSPFGPAVSSDGVHYAFCPEKTKIDAFSFRYGFGADEDEKYFAFSLPYTAERFYGFAAKNGFEPFEFARSEQGRVVTRASFRRGRRDRFVYLSASLLRVGCVVRVRGSVDGNTRLADFKKVWFFGRADGGY